MIMHASNALAALFILLSIAGARSACTSDLDCSLAGTCKQGQCECQSWTKGADCAALNMKPVDSLSAIKPLVQPHDAWTRWGGSVVYSDGKYHMFSAEMAFKCSLSVWGFKSQVIHSVSDNPYGPFTFESVAVGTEAHNPVLSQAVDGTWLLWTCGCPHTPNNQKCDHETLTCPGGAAAAWTTTVYSSKSLNGPWTPHVNLLGNITKGRLGSQNVSPIMAANGSVYLMFKGPDNNTEASIAYAPSWQGPYKLLHVNIFAKYYSENITNEDVWWWQSKDGIYHALSHRMTPADRESFEVGGHAFATSMDDWSYALTPAYTREVALKDGSTVNLTRRERPQLLLNEDGEPTYVYNAVGFNSTTFTFCQQLGDL
eukprot:m.18329 g.18329  ORF g.18329 m.18329 type:complete len:371 (+) comp6282_c0_seq2:164-1276(+)